MRAMILLAGCALAACSPSAPAGDNVADNAMETSAADTAAADNDMAAMPAPAEPVPVAAPLPAPTPIAVPTPTPVVPPAPGEPGGLPDDRTPVSEAPFTPESAQGAANVVQIYYALIGEGKYRQAWELWEQGGKASGTSAEQFARGLRQYREYHANIGAPGDVDAGAGQRFVTVPVQVYGRRDNGAAFNQRGSVTLHRVADIPGSSKAERSWHIRSIDLKETPMGDPPGRDRPGRDHGDRPDHPRR